MADKKITQFETFSGEGDSSVFFVIASGAASDPLSENYKVSFNSLVGLLTPPISPWRSNSTAIYSLTGSVGIGTSSPTYKLDVLGDISGFTGNFKGGAFSDSLTISGQPVATGEGGKWSGGASAGDIYYDEGKVGVGMDPAYQLSVKGGLGDGIVVHNSVGALRSALYLDVGDNAVFNLKNNVLADGVHLSASGTSNFQGPLTISGNPVSTGAGGGASKWSDGASAGEIYYNGGNVGIGTTNPSETLHVTGGKILAPSGDFTKSLTISGQTVATGAGGKWSDGASAGEIYYNGGNVGIGTTNPSDTLHVTGGKILAPSGEFTESFNLSGTSVALQSGLLIDGGYF